MSKDGIIVIERYQRGGLVAYSVDEGETFHATVDQAFEHKAECSDTEGAKSSENKTLRTQAKGTLPERGTEQ